MVSFLSFNDVAVAVIPQLIKQFLKDTNCEYRTHAIIYRGKNLTTVETKHNLLYTSCCGSQNSENNSNKFSGLRF